MADNDNYYLSKVGICPDCGNREFAIGLTGGSAGLFQSGYLSMFSPRIRKISVICKSCGLIAKEYAEEPDRLK